MIVILVSKIEMQRVNPTFLPRKAVDGLPRGRCLRLNSSLPLTAGSLQAITGAKHTRNRKQYIKQMQQS